MWYTHVRFNFRKKRSRANDFEDFDAEIRFVQHIYMFVWLCVCNTDAFILSGWSKCVTYVNILFLINIKRSGSREQKDWNDVFAFKRKKSRIRHEFARYFVEYDFPIFLLPYSFCLMRHTRLFRIHLIILIISSVFVSVCAVCVFILFWYCNMALLKSCTFPFICITFVSRKYAFVFRVYIDFAFTIYSRWLGGGVHRFSDASISTLSCYM